MMFKISIEVFFALLLTDRIVSFKLAAQNAARPLCWLLSAILMSFIVGNQAWFISNSLYEVITSNGQINSIRKPQKVKSLNLCWPLNALELLKYIVNLVRSHFAVTVVPTDLMDHNVSYSASSSMKYTLPYLQKELSR